MWSNKCCHTWTIHHLKIILMLSETRFLNYIKALFLFESVIIILLNVALQSQHCVRHHALAITGSETRHVCAMCACPQTVWMFMVVLVTGSIKRWPGIIQVTRLLNCIVCLGLDEHEVNRWHDRWWNKDYYKGKTAQQTLKWHVEYWSIFSSQTNN